VYKPKPRKKYSALSSKTWKDRDTGLIWQVEIDKKGYKWSDAKNYCSRLTLSGYSNWKLPNREELNSIRTKNGYKNSKGYTGETYIKKPLLESMSMKWQWFWSVTKSNKYSSRAWYVGFINGNDYFRIKSDELYVRCVVGRQ